MQPLHATSLSLPTLNVEAVNRHSNEMSTRSAAAETESLSLAKNRFRSAVSKGLEVLSHHHGYSRNRAAAFILHHIRTCAVSGSDKEKGDALVPYPNDDEVSQLRP